MTDRPRRAIDLLWQTVVNQCDQKETWAKGSTIIELHKNHAFDLQDAFVLAAQSSSRVNRRHWISYRPFSGIAESK